MSRTPLSEYSLITAAVAWMMRHARKLSPMQWLSGWIPELTSRGSLTPAELKDIPFIKRRGRAVEGYIIGCITYEVLAITMLAVSRPNKWALAALVLPLYLRIAEIMQVTVNATVFDYIEGRTDNSVASSARMMVLAFVNLAELIVAFAVLYSAELSSLTNANGVGSALYFSVTTQLTIGYGDLLPTGYLRVVAAAQGLLGLAFLVLVFARLVNALPRIRSVFDDDKFK